MGLDKLFSAETAVKVFYAYLAVSVGHTGVEAATASRPDIIAEKVVSMEKRMERIENLVIEIIRTKS